MNDRREYERLKNAEIVLGGRINKLHEKLEAAEAENVRLHLIIKNVIPVVDELIAWVNTDNIGCLEVIERGENTLRQLRDLIDRKVNT